MNWVTAIGLIAATCTTVAHVPQVIKAIKTKQTKDISLLMYSIFLLELFVGLLMEF